MTRVRRITVMAGVVAGVLSALSCGPELTEPADTSVTGRWALVDTADVLYDLRLDLAQTGEGIVSGSWQASTVRINGVCPAELGCAPANGVEGSNTRLQLYLSVLGAGTFTGQVTSANEFRGNLARSSGNFAVRFTRE